MIAPDGRWPCLMATWLVTVVMVSPAAAQQGGDTPALRPGHVTVSGGIGWIGSYTVGDRTAELRGNGPGASAAPFDLFRASSSIDASLAPEARIGFAVTPALTVEAGVSYHRPGLTTSISGDSESAAVTLDSEQLVQYLVDVAAVWQIPGASLGQHARPFVLAGGGYLRQLYDERTLVETGSVYFAGAGLRYWLRGGDGATRSIGLRGEARALWRRKGVEFEGKTRVAPTAALHLFVEF